MEETNFASISDRIKAVFADSLVIIGFLISFTYFFESFEHVHENAKIIAFVFVFALYDPLMLSIFGGTIGHMVVGIRVKREKNHSKNIYFHMALLRFIIKISLGWISLLSISFNKNKKAIHDYAANSVVIYKDEK